MLVLIDSNCLHVLASGCNNGTNGRRKTSKVERCEEGSNLRREIGEETSVWALLDVLTSCSDDVTDRRGQTAQAEAVQKVLNLWRKVWYRTRSKKQPICFPHFQEKSCRNKRLQK